MNIHNLSYRWRQMVIFHTLTDPHGGTVIVRIKGTLGHAVTDPRETVSLHLAEVAGVDDPILRAEGVGAADVQVLALEQRLDDADVILTVIVLRKKHWLIKCLKIFRRKMVTKLCEEAILTRLFPIDSHRRRKSGSNRGVYKKMELNHFFTIFLSRLARSISRDETV